MANSMTLVGKEPGYGGVELYKRKNDELKIGGAELTSIEYAFWQRQLSDVRIKFKGYANFSAVKDAMTEKFGKPHTANRYLEHHEWPGKITYMNLKYSKASDAGLLTMHCTATSEKQKEHANEDTETEVGTGF